MAPDSGPSCDRHLGTYGHPTWCDRDPKRSRPDKGEGWSPQHTNGFGPVEGLNK